MEINELIDLLEMALPGMRELAEKRPEYHVDDVIDLIYVLDASVLLSSITTDDDDIYHVGSMHLDNLEKVLDIDGHQTD